MNKVVVSGNLSRDVELKYMPSGAAVGSFGIGTNRKWKDKNTGEQKQEVMFIDVEIFGKSAEIMNQYVSKGSKVLIEGRLRLNQWQDQQGNNRSKHTITCENFEFLDSKPKAQQPQSTGNYNGVPTETYAAPQQQSFNVDDDNIPF